MKLMVQGFTLIEFVFTLIILSVIGWVLYEIIRHPVAQYVFHAQNVQILYEADLAINQIEKNIKDIEKGSLEVSDNQLSFSVSDQLNAYQCEDRQLWWHINDDSHLLANNVSCQFEQRTALSEVEIDVLLTFGDDQNELRFFRQFYFPAQ